MPADERFEQRIAGEAVRAVQAGAGHFADGVEARDVRLPIHIRHHAAALIMRGGHDRNRFARDVYAVIETGLVDIRKTIANKSRKFVADVKQHVIAPAFFISLSMARASMARGGRVLRGSGRSMNAAPPGG